MSNKYRWICGLAKPAVIGFVLASLLVLVGFHSDLGIGLHWAGPPFKPLPGYDIIVRGTPRLATLEQIEQRYGSPLERTEDGRRCSWACVMTGKSGGTEMVWLLGGPILDYGDGYDVGFTRCVFDKDGTLAKWRWDRGQVLRWDRGQVLYYHILASVIMC